MTAIPVQRHQFAQSRKPGRWRHRIDGCDGRIGAQRHEHMAEHPIVQSHGENRQEAEAKPGKAQPLSLRQRGKPGATEKDRCGGQDNRFHEDGERKQQCTAKGRQKSFGRAGSRRADNRQQTGNEQDVGSRVCEAARRPLCVLHKAGAEYDADRNGDKDDAQRERPVERQKPLEQCKDKKREQQHEREIAEVDFAKNNVLEPTEIAQTGTAVKKD